MKNNKTHIDNLKPKFSRRYKGMECRVYLVRENPSRKPIVINGPDDIYKLVRDEMASSDRETLLSILLNGMNAVIGIETVSAGGLNSCIVSLREVFKSAILANAAAIVLCHNHVSGNLEPSEEDLKITQKMVEAGELLGIRVHDHLIISHEGYRSIMDKIKPIERSKDHVF
jgi:DNA repair protein RadC